MIGTFRLLYIHTWYEVQENWPGYVVIGSDMSGQLWAYCPENKTYCQIDSANTDPDTYYTISDSFENFLKIL